MSRSENKTSGACVHCKSLKVRCEFALGETTCQRCQAGNYECQPRSRKKRKPAPTHEDLQERAHNQDCQIQNLLLQFDKMTAEHKVNGWISHSAELRSGALQCRSKLGIKEGSKTQWDGDSSPEVAAQATFSHGRGPTLISPPDIVKYCMLYPSDILELFKIYFEKINPFFSLLDPELHSAQRLIWTSPFLFTVICATASRLYTTRPDLHDLATRFARAAAGKALVDGSKSVDVCQAYLILSVYPVPKRKWADDRSWLFMGLAIRMAIELNLNQEPPANCDEREALNRTRTWLNCYCADGSHAIQFGKIPMLRLDDFLVAHSQGWYRASTDNLPYDVHLCAYAQLIVIMARWRSGLHQGKEDKDFDVVQYCLDTAEKLLTELNLWVSRYEEEYSYKPLLICAYRGNTTQMITAYLRLVVLAAAFQDIAKDGRLTGTCEIFRLSVDAARTVIQVTIERLYPTGHLKNAMTANFLYVSFAAAFLINLLRPSFLPLLDEDTKEEITYSVQKLVSVLSSKDVAMDGMHISAQYSTFLASLLSKYKIGPQRVDSGMGGNYSHERQYSAPSFSWPDVREPLNTSTFLEPSADIAYRQAGDVEMDFSLNNFVRSVKQEFPHQGGSSVVTEWPDSWDYRDGAVWAAPPYAMSGGLNNI